jgi:REP element-mobilizing transposase RayT
METSFHKRNLPHLYFSDGIYFVTYRLANSIPLDKLKLIKSKNSLDWDFEKFSRLFEKYDKLLNSNKLNTNYLAQNEIADICKQTIHYYDGKEYTLICYCIMPNHIHLVFELLPGNKGISKIMQSIKGISARRCNLQLNISDSFWQDESFDRWIRNDKELYHIIRYVLLNPVSAGLVNSWNEWRNTYCNPNYMIL